MPVPIKKDKIVRVSTKERVYATLRDWIMDGTLQPEERLNDKEIAEHFAVSRTPVREALQMLAEQKFVTVLPSSGTFVASIDKSDMVQVYHLMGGLQSLALEMAMERIAAQDIAQLRGLNSAFVEAARGGNLNEINRAHTALHHRIAELSGNEYLTRFTDILMMQAFRGERLFFTSGSRRSQSAEQHEAIIAALEKRDLSSAREWMKKNWDFSFWEEQPGGSPSSDRAKEPLSQS